MQYVRENSEKVGALIQLLLCFAVGAFALSTEIGKSRREGMKYREKTAKEREKLKQETLKQSRKLKKASYKQKKKRLKNAAGRRLLILG